MFERMGVGHHPIISHKKNKQEKKKHVRTT